MPSGCWRSTSPGSATCGIDRAGDAVDRWETLVRDSAASPLAERAWARAGDAYFQAERYTDARRCYQGLLAHFAGSPAASIASLRLAQCAYNSGDDAAALEGFARVAADYPGSGAGREALRGQERSLYRLSQDGPGQRGAGAADRSVSDQRLRRR